MKRASTALKSIKEVQNFNQEDPENYTGASVFNSADQMLFFDIRKQLFFRHKSLDRDG